MNFGKTLAGIGIAVASMVGASIIDKGLHKIVDPRFDDVSEPDPDGGIDLEEASGNEIPIVLEEFEENIEETSD